MMVWSPGDPGTDWQVRITERSRDALLQDIERRVDTGDGFSLATLNLDHVVKLRRSREFRDAYRVQTHVTADGRPIVWLSCLAGERIELLPGSELVDPVAALAARKGIGVALLGTTETALAKAADQLRRTHPGLEVVLHLSPRMGFDPTGADADAAIADIAGSGAGLCFLALGAPKQEVFSAYARSRLPNVGFLSIGAGLDFIAGTQRRAPPVVRMLAAEWIWRLAENPKRLAARYGACLCILPSLILAGLRARYARP